MPSFSTSMDPEQTKKMAWSASPCRRRYSPGAQKDVLMCRDRERRQPRLAEANNDSSRISLLRCMVMSERNSSGKSFSSCGDDERERGKAWDSQRERDRGGRQEWGEHDSCENIPFCSSVIKFPGLGCLLFDSWAVAAQGTLMSSLYIYRTWRSIASVYNLYNRWKTTSNPSIILYYVWRNFQSANAQEDI